MTTINKYRVKCETDNKFEYVWSESLPTVCPSNTAHTINTNTITIVDSVKNKVLQIKEESVPTGGNFQARTMSLPNITGNSITTEMMYFPFPISAMSVNIVTTQEHKGDIVNMYAGKDTIIGVIGQVVAPASAWVSQNYTTGSTVTFTHPIFGSRVYTCIKDTVSNETPLDGMYWKHGYEILVNSTVIENTSIGYELNLFDGVNTSNLGRVLCINIEMSKVYVEINPDQTFSPLTPTYVRQTVYIIRDFVIGEPWDRCIGDSKIGGSHIPADTPVEFSYQNVTGDTKNLVGHVEFLY